GFESADVADHMSEAEEIIATSELVRSLVVQRSRSYARESQIQETGSATMFPKRLPPKVADYSIRNTYGNLLEMFVSAFSKTNPLFNLPIYFPLAWYKGPDIDIDPLDEGRQMQVVGLIRTNFLKRFESSVAAFEMSCDRLLKKLLVFVDVNSETDGERNRLERWKLQNADILGIKRQFELWDEESDDTEEDFIPQEMLDKIEKLKREDYDVPGMLAETFLDLDQIGRFLKELQQFEPKNDDKLKKLIRLLKTNELSNQKILIFTEFADTAQYLKKQLIQNEI
ncbi:uncharacterized protein METZ01_LOCUS402449, partial [marine metagenome]